MGLPKGFKHSEEAKKKMRQSSLGLKHTEETKKKMSKSLKKYYYLYGEELIKKKRNLLKGNKYRLNKKHTEETKEKMRKSHIGKHIGKDNGMYGLYGKDNPNYGKNHTKERKMKISKTLKGRHCCPRTEFKKGQFVGFKNFNWKGGITPLQELIRNSYEGRQWRNNIFKRDNYTCQECNNDKGGNLHAHHIKPFANILHEFLQEYNQFSPIDDKETLVRLAINYKPFWDIDNGITYCKKCHELIKKGKVSGY